MQTRLLLLLLVVLLSPQLASAQSKDAVNACTNINPVTAWYECINRYEARLREMREDPRYQAEQKRQAEELRLRAEEIENQKRIIAEMERQRILPGNGAVNCQSRRVGNTVHTSATKHCMSLLVTAIRKKRYDLPQATSFDGTLA